MPFVPYNTRMKLVLFDVDGTLLRTGGRGVSCMELAGQALFGPDFTTPILNPAGSMDPDLYAQLVAHHGIEDGDACHGDFQQHYLHHLTEKLSRPGAAWALPGVIALLDQLRAEPNVDLGLVTGNYTRAVPIKLQAAGIDPGWFEDNAFGDQAADRAGMIRLARQRHTRRTGKELDGNDVLMVGDTPNDVNAARQAECLCLAVATGRFSVDDLRAAGAQHAVEDLSDPASLLSILHLN